MEQAHALERLDLAAALLRAQGIDEDRIGAWMQR
jgi:hypothetical protein